MKQNTRRSTDASTANNTTSVASETQCNGSPNDEKATMENVMSLLEQMNGNFARLNDSNEALKLLIANKASTEVTKGASEITTMKQSLTALHAKFDHHCTSRSTTESNNTSSIMQRIDSLHESLSEGTRTTKNVSEKIATQCIRASTTRKSKNRPTSDPLDWSFSFNQSTLPNDNIELYQLLNGFEQNTWTTFDDLRRKLNENNDTVLNIESICKEINSKYAQQRLESPVIDSIRLDTLQTIQEKCESIEEKVQACMTTPSLWNEDMSSYSTQNLRERLHKLVSTNVDVNMDTHGDTVSLPTGNNVIDNLSNYSIIDKLLEVRPNANNINSRMDNISTSHRRQTHSTSSPEEIHNRNSSNEMVSPAPCVIEFDHEIHVSRLPTTTTCEEVKDYISCQSSSSIDIEQLKVYRLLKKNQDISQLIFLSFKIETNSAIAEQLLNAKFWPSHVCVKVWINKRVQFPRLLVSQPLNDFLSRTNAEYQKR